MPDAALGHNSSKLLAILFLLLTALVAAPADDVRLALPNRPDSVKFAAIGDSGTGDQAQYDVARELARWHGAFPFGFVIMLGDNLYGSQDPPGFVQKFERPYAPLLDAGVTFYAAVGNHDRASNPSYPPFHMSGRRYYDYVRKNVRFVVIDSDQIDPDQLDWIERTLRGAREDWKICYFHHPLYSSGIRHGSQFDVRVLLEPLFVKYGVNVVFSGHDHVYERIKPQKGIYYFVSGAAGQLRKNGLAPSSLTAAGDDQDRSFMLNEIAGNNLFFQVVSRTGQTVDSGIIVRQNASGRRR